MPGQPFGDPAHLIDDTVQMLEQTAGAGALMAPLPAAMLETVRSMTGALAMRPGAHDITVMVPTLAPRSCGNRSQGATPATRVSKRM